MCMYVCMYIHEENHFFIIYVLSHIWKEMIRYNTLNDILFKFDLLLLCLFLFVKSYILNIVISYKRTLVDFSIRKKNVILSSFTIIWIKKFKFRCKRKSCVSLSHVDAPWDSHINQIAFLTFKKSHITTRKS